MGKRRVRDHDLTAEIAESAERELAEKANNGSHACHWQLACQLGRVCIAHRPMATCFQIVVGTAHRPMAEAVNRNYNSITATLKHKITPDAGRDERMQVVVDLLWDRLHDKGVSWVGFYLHVPEPDEMILGPRRDKPACSPIGMRGACGRAFLRNQPMVVRDVKELGENYITCDPRDQSEIVIPIHDSNGRSIGVLDLDSFEVGSFDDSDLTGLTRVLTAAGLCQTTKSH